MTPTFEPFAMKAAKRFVGCCSDWTQYDSATPKMCWLLNSISLSELLNPLINLCTNRINEFITNESIETKKKKLWNNVWNVKSKSQLICVFEAFCYFSHTLKTSESNVNTNVSWLFEIYNFDLVLDLTSHTYTNRKEFFHGVRKMSEIFYMLCYYSGGTILPPIIARSHIVSSPTWLIPSNAIEMIENINRTAWINPIDTIALRPPWN